MVRWFPSVTLSKREQFLIGRMTRTGKLFAFRIRSVWHVVDMLVATT